MEYSSATKGNKLLIQAAKLYAQMFYVAVKEARLKRLHVV